MIWKRIAARAISEVCFFTGLNERRSGLRILLYHAVGSCLPGDKYGISIEPKLFERQIRSLTGDGSVQVVGLDNATFSDAALQVAVTFDDGYKDNLRTAAPVLLKYEVPFTVFVTSSFINKNGTVYLTSEELKELASLPGVTIGSHGASHQPLAKCDDLTLSRELADSHSEIEDIIGRPVTYFSYPHGSVTRRVRDAASRAGYVIGACSRFGVNDQSRDNMLLRRCEIIAADSERVFSQKLSGAWDWYKCWLADPADDSRGLVDGLI